MSLTFRVSNVLTNTNGESLGRTAGFTRDAKQRPPLSGHKFDVSKIVQYTGECSLGDAHEYWLRPGSWTKQVRNLMLNCTIPAQFWTHFAPMCCAPTVVVPWETKFERPSNAGPGWQNLLFNLKCRMTVGMYRVLDDIPGPLLYADSPQLSMSTHFLSSNTTNSRG